MSTAARADVEAADSRTAERGSVLRRVSAELARHGRSHPGPFVKGCLAAVLVIAARLSMPWPLHALMHLWKNEQRSAAVVAEGSHQALLFGVLFLLLLAALGLGDAVLRLQFARFSIGTIRDLRAAALRAALNSLGTKLARPGDLVARLIGDTARIKAGLKGFLVHVAPNGALYLGVTVILLRLNVELGLIFGLAGLSMLLATLIGARAMYRRSKKLRKKEGRLADRIDDAVRSGEWDEGFATTNRSSARHEAALTRIQSLTTSTTYVLYGLAVLAAIAVGTGEIAAGRLESRDMVVFLVYALIIRGPTVRLARQGTRLGKILAPALRVVQVIERRPTERSPVAAPPSPITNRPTQTGGPMPLSRTTRVLFTGYAPVHYLCFRPLHERLRTLDGVQVFVSGGLERRTETRVTHDEAAMYGPLGVDPRCVLPVSTIKEQDFDFLFAGNTTLIEPRSVGTRVQHFHGVSFRNRAIRPANMNCDHYFLVGPYMHRRFIESGLMTEDDPRALQVGFMKTDRLRNGSLDRNALLAEAGLDGQRPVLVYAPTGQKRNSLEIVGEDVIGRLVGSGEFDVILKLHDHPKNADIDWPARLAHLVGPRFRLSRESDVVKLLFLADLLITDASSVSSEFTLLDRPLVFLDVPDLLAKAERKQDSMLDLDTWGRRTGATVEDPSTIVEVVRQSLAQPAERGEVRRAMAADLFYNPGHATDHAFDWFCTASGRPQASATRGVGMP